MSYGSPSPKAQLARRLARMLIDHERWGSDFCDEINPRDEMFQLMQNSPDYREASERFEYLKSGYEVELSITNLLNQSMRSFRDTGRVLEFACGYGRFTRFLSRYTEPDQLVVSDIMRDAVSWVSKTFSVPGIVSHAEPDRVDLKGPYGLIFVGSLFSHLPEFRFKSWLEKLHNALSDDGWLVFSTHGYDVRDDISKDPSGFTFTPQSESSVLEAVEYGSTFVRPSYLKALIESLGFGSLYTCERDLWAFQDLHVLSKSEIPELNEWHSTSLVHGRIDRVHVKDSGEYWIDGWSADTLSGSPLPEVTLALDGKVIGKAEIGRQRLDVAEKMKRPNWVDSGWTLHGKSEPIRPGLYCLASLARTTSGRRVLVDVRPIDFRSDSIRLGPETRPAP